MGRHLTRIVFFLCMDFHPSAWKAPIAGGENRRLGRAEKQMPAGQIQCRSEAKRLTAPWKAEYNRTRRARGNENNRSSKRKPTQSRP